MTERRAERGEQETAAPTTDAARDTSEFDLLDPDLNAPVEPEEEAPHTFDVGTPEEREEFECTLEEHARAREQRERIAQSEG